MLAYPSLTSVPRDCDRRWISDDWFDLIVWYAAGGEVLGFQLCYDKGGTERALTWLREGGTFHAWIDSGETSPLANRTPVLMPIDEFPVEQVRAEFMVRGRELPEELRALVLDHMDAFARRSGA